jgi:hypothetical protein
MLQKAGLSIAISFAATLLVACGAPQMPRPPEHGGAYELSPPVERQAPSHRVSVVEVEQQRLLVNESDEPLSSLSVTVELSVPKDGEPWRVDGSALRMVADVPEGGRLLAAGEEASRAPDAVEVRRDGDWMAADSLEIEPGSSRQVRLAFESLTPYAVVGEEWEAGARTDGWNGYYRPVGLRLLIPSPSGASEELVISDPADASPVWKRDHVDTRLHMLIAPGVLAQPDGGTGFLFGFGMGAMHDFEAPVYLRWAADLQIGHVPDATGVVAARDADVNRATYLRLTAPLTAGGVLKSTNYDMRLGAGWSTGIVSRSDVDPVAVPHYLVGEYEFVVRPNQAYPFRTRDFAGNLGLYTRVSYQLGNLAAHAEPAGALFTVGIALHPEF